MTRFGVGEAIKAVERIKRNIVVGRWRVPRVTGLTKYRNVMNL